MEYLLTYLIKSSLSLTIFYICYVLFFKREVYFKFSRFLLLFMILAVVILPLIPYNAAQIVSAASVPLNEIVIYSHFPQYTLDEVVIEAGGQPYFFLHGLSVALLILMVYLSGVLFRLFQFLFRLAQILLLIKRSETIKSDGLTYVLTEKGSPTYSFLHWIFINRDLLKKKDELSVILYHEEIHAQQGHTFDLIIAEILTIIQWFNPFAYLLKKIIKENHEYLTDKEVITNQHNAKAYRVLLLNHSSIIKTNILTHNFSYLLLKRRLKMMKKTKHPIRFGLGMLILAATLIMVVFACSRPEENNPNAVGINKSGTDSVFTVVETMPEFPGGMDGLVQYLGSNIKYPEEAKDNGIEGRVFVNFIIEKDGSIGKAKILRGIGSGCDKEALRVVSGMPKWKPGIQRDQAVRVRFNLPIRFQLDLHGADSVYTVVKNMPEFPGGVSALMQYLASNIKYPEMAKKEGIQGRVFVNFIVERSGRISRVKILRGIGGGCDEEAVRVISAMPRWKPGLVNGKPVRVSYNVPIKFTLD